VFDLVLWSFMIALTWMALELAWRLVFLVANSIGHGLPRTSEDNEPLGPPHTTKPHRTSSYVLRPRRIPSMEAPRSLSPGRRRSLGGSAGLSIH
jgi:hypothetical protein